MQFILFLKRINQEKHFSLITGYELRDDKVFPLDGSTVEEGTQEFPFDEYEGFDAAAFLKIVRDTIAKTPQASAQGGK